MKKIRVLVAVLAIMMTCACSKTVTLLNENAEITEFPDSAVSYAESLMADVEDAEIGSGIYVNRITSAGGIEKTETMLFPVYCEGSLDCLILLEGDDEEVISDEDLMKILNDNTDRWEFMLDVSGGKLLGVSNVETIVLNGDDELDELEKGTIVKLQKLSIKNSRIGLMRQKLKTATGNVVIGPDGQIYSADRIVVRFTEGEGNEKKKMFEEFCQGSFRRSIKSQNTYVFQVKPQSYSKLMEIVNEAEKLDYVVSAWLDKANQPHESSSNANRKADR